MLALTLNVNDTLLQDLVQHLWVLKLFADLGNDAIGQLLLLARLYLSLVTHP